MAVRVGGPSEEEVRALEKIQRSILKAKDPAMAIIGFEQAISDLVSTSIDKWADSEKPDIRDVIAAVYLAHDYRKMWKALAASVLKRSHVVKALPTHHARARRKSA